jgi:hypothetical protein
MQMFNRPLNRIPLVLVTLLGLGISASAQITTAENGLSISTSNTNTVQLGGSLLYNTAIDLGNFGFTLKRGNTPLFSTLSNGNIGLGTITPGARVSFPDVNASEDPFGITWYNPEPLLYGIHRTAGPWTGPDWQQLRLGWATGIILDPGTAYGKSYVDIIGNGLRVTQGNIGIGTTNPHGLLSLGNSVSNGKLAIWQGDYNGQTYSAGIGMQPGQFRLYIPSYDNRFSFLAAEDATNEVMTIQGTGNVGIGNSAPHSKLEVGTNPADDATPYQPTIWDSYSARVNGNLSIFSSGSSSAYGDSYELNFYARYGNGGQGIVTNKAGYIKATAINDYIYPPQAMGRGTLILGSTNTNYNNNQFINVPALYVSNGKVGIGEASPQATLQIKTSTADASASDFQLVDNAGGTILSVRNDQKFTVGSGTQSTQFVIAGTGYLSGIYSPAYASASNNVISFKDYNGNTRMTFDMSNGTDGKLDVSGNIKAAGFILPTGAAAGMVLTSDANGNATWQTATGSGTAGWGFGGNSVATSSALGTTSNYDLPIITNNTEQMRIGANGNVGIGTTSIASYKLSVNGNIRTRKVRVDQDTWADYVFENNYQLRPINELERYIQVEKHLPDVPSAAEVKKEGLDLGDNQAVLLKKIEELTLYVIEQNKKIEALQKMVLQQQNNKDAKKKGTK